MKQLNVGAKPLVVLARIWYAVRTCCCEVRARLELLFDLFCVYFDSCNFLKRSQFSLQDFNLFRVWVMLHGVFVQGPPEVLKFYFLRWLDYFNFLLDNLSVKFSCITVKLLVLYFIVKFFLLFFNTVGYC